MLANLGFNNSFNNSARKLSMLKSNSPQFQAHVQAVNAQIVNSSTNFPTIFDNALLESIEYCGFGSWKNITERLKTNLENPKFAPINIDSPDQVQRYYLSVFSRQFTELGKEYEFVIKSGSIIETRFSENNNNKYLSDDSKNHLSNTKRSKKRSGDQAKSSAHNFVTTISCSEPRTDCVLTKDIPQTHEYPLLKYRKERGDFELEFDDDAECLIAELTDEIDSHTEKRSDYSDLLKKLRLALCEDYTKYRVNERHRRKRFLQKSSLELIELSELSRINPEINSEIQGINSPSISTNPLKSCTQLACPTKVQQLITSIKSAKSIRERIKLLETTRLDQLNTEEKVKNTISGEKVKFDNHPLSVNDSNNNVTPGVTSFNYLSETERKIANTAKISVEKFTMLKVDCILQSKGGETMVDDCVVKEIVKSGSSVKERKLVSVLCGELVGGDAKL